MFKRILASSLFDFLIRLLVVASIILGISTSLSQRALSSCVADWGDRYTAASKARASANQARLDAQNQLTLDFIEHVPDSVFSSDAVLYIQADEKYKTTVATHPLPDPPRLAC